MLQVSKLVISDSILFLEMSGKQDFSIESSIVYYGWVLSLFLPRYVFKMR